MWCQTTAWTSSDQECCIFLLLFLLILAANLSRLVTDDSMPPPPSFKSCAKLNTNILAADNFSRLVSDDSLPPPPSFKSDAELNTNIIFAAWFLPIDTCWNHFFISFDILTHSKNDNWQTKWFSTFQKIDHSCQDNKRLEAQKHHRSWSTSEIITQKFTQFIFCKIYVFSCYVLCS